MSNAQIPKLRIRPSNNAVLITGCDTGFGNLLARKLDSDGFKVYACCLFPAGDNAKQLKADCSGLLQIIKLDVTSDADVEAAYKKVERDLELSDYRKLTMTLNLFATRPIWSLLEPCSLTMHAASMLTVLIANRIQT